MKKSLKKRYQILLLIFFAIFIIESALILVTVLSNGSITRLKADLQSIVIMFVFIQFIYFVVLFYYIPYQYEHANREIYHILQEISEGKYQIDLEAKTYNQSEEITNLIKALHRMMNIVSKFDSLKADKIYEHHQRIQMLINMIPQGCLIMSIIGEIVYINDFVKKNFPALTENLNIMETLLPDYVEAELKPLLIESLKSGNNLQNKTVTISAQNVSYLINSSIVRNRKGQSTGAIFIIVKA
ncbi:MAG: hypothetical protein R6V77_03955 [Candidatus Cloacimonadaceae bacterium]